MPQAPWFARPRPREGDHQRGPRAAVRACPVDGTGSVTRAELPRCSQPPDPSSFFHVICLNGISSFVVRLTLRLTCGGRAANPSTRPGVTAAAVKCSRLLDRAENYEPTGPL